MALHSVLDPASRWSQRVFGAPETLLVAASMVVLAVVFAALEPAFLSGPNLSTILRTIAFIGIVAVGQTLLLVSGDFDLSVGSVAGLGAVFSALLMADLGLPVAVAVLGGLLAGGLVGLVNGLLTVHVGIPAFLVTLGMLFAAKGLTFVLSSGQQIYPLPDGVALLAAEPFGLPVSVWVFVAVVLIGDLLLRKSTYGRRVYAIGGNEKATRLSGINTKRTRVAGFVATGALAAAAGVLLMARLGSGDPQIGSGWELTVIVAVVVGGVSLFGGIGTVVGALVGLLFLQVLSTGLVITGFDATLQPAVLGVVLIAALGLKALVRHN